MLPILLLVVPFLPLVWDELRRKKRGNETEDEMKIVVNINAPIYGSLTLNFNEIRRQINITAESVSLTENRFSLRKSLPSFPTTHSLPSMYSPELYEPLNDPRDLYLRRELERIRFERSITVKDK